MNADPVRMKRLEAEIALRQSALAEYRAALQKLQNELDGFARQYDRIIGPLEAQLDSIRQEIEARQATASLTDTGSIWGPGFSSIEESFDAKYRNTNSQNPMIRVGKKKISENDLRLLYRKLARKYHPDTTTDPAEKARLTMIMAQINAAYRAKNAEELYALDGQRPPSAVRANESIVPPGMTLPPTYSDLVKQAQTLDDEILWVKSEHQRLLHGPLMALKLEYSIARSQGRDLLREIAAKVRADVDAARAELNSLRR